MIEPSVSKENEENKHGEDEAISLEGKNKVQKDTPIVEVGEIVTIVTENVETTTSESCNPPQPSIYNRFVTSFENAIHDLVHEPDVAETGRILSTFDLEGIANFIKEESPKNIIFMVGAGISTSAGIPDFRTPGTGLYDNLQKYKLPHPQAIFQIDFFRKNPEPFFTLAKELFHEDIKPTPSHYFIRLVEKKGLLRRCFSQNIDSLEIVSGLREDKLVLAHGSTQSSTCLSCKKKYDHQWIMSHIYQKDDDKLVPRCEKPGCNGVVKPDIVFFGESLPPRFFTASIMDFPKCDLLIIMGTSLAVQPFASLVDQVPKDIPRLLINKTRAGEYVLDFDSERNNRDVFWAGECDAGVLALAKYLGWEDELRALINAQK